MKIIFNPRAFWIGVHYSKYNKRYCINIIPIVTITFIKKGGKKYEKMFV